LVDPISKVEEVVRESGGITADDFVKIVSALGQFGRDIASIPPPGADGESDGNVVTPKRRYLLTLLGFFERTYNLTASTATLAATPQGMALLDVLGKAIENLTKFLN
jgi:hypothetical protein